ncbi:MAG: hypothetical protein R2735_14885 [Microthrixaceae bacterium]
MSEMFSASSEVLTVSDDPSSEAAYVAFGNLLFTTESDDRSSKAASGEYSTRRSRSVRTLTRTFPATTIWPTSATGSGCTMTALISAFDRGELTLEPLLELGFP